VVPFVGYTVPAIGLLAIDYGNHRSKHFLDLIGEKSLGLKVLDKDINLDTGKHKHSILEFTYAISR
jgi:hypothetical protein